MDMFGNLDFGLRSTATAVSPCAGQKLRRVESGLLLKPSPVPICLANKDLGPLDGDNWTRLGATWAPQVTTRLQPQGLPG